MAAPRAPRRQAKISTSRTGANGNRGSLPCRPVADARTGCFRSHHASCLLRSVSEDNAIIASKLMQKRYLMLALKVAGSLSLVALVLWTVDIRAAIDAGVRLSAQGATLAALLLFAQVPLLALRWRLVAARMNMPMNTKDALVLTWAGMFFNLALPSSMGGDVVRAWALRQRGEAWASAIGSVVIDRIVALLALLAMIAVALPWIARLPDSGPLTVTVSALLLASVLGLCVLPFMAGASRRLPGWLQQVGEMLVAASRVLLSLGPMSLLLLYSLLVHLLACLTVYVLATSMGVALALVDSLVLVPLVILTLALPFSYAGWGLREGAMVVLLGFAGVSSAEALAISLLMGVILFLVQLPGLAWWLMRPRSERAPADAWGRDA